MKKRYIVQLVVVLVSVVAVFARMQFVGRHYERTIAEGRTVLLALAPIDPRSLMQGDYMILRYEDPESLNWEQARKKLPHVGTLIYRVDENRVATFARIDRGEPLAQGEVRLKYRNHRGGPRIGPGSFFFQEGHAELYEEARFAVLRVAEDGQALLTGLADEKHRRLGHGKAGGR